MFRTNLAFIASFVFLLGNESFSEQNEGIAQIRRLQVQQLMLKEEHILLNDLQLDRGPSRSQDELYRLEFERRIEELNEICKLTPPQLKKLRVASKGAILKTVEEQQNNQKKLVDNWGNEGFFVEIGVRQFRGDPFSQPIWTKTITKVLNDEQRQLLAAHQKKQNAKRRRANVIRYLGQLDNLLTFDSEQRSKIYSLIDEKFGKHFESIYDSRSLRPINALIPAQLLQAPEVEEQIKQILSKEQFDIWRVYSKVGAQRQLILDQAEVAQFPNRPMLGVRLVDDIKGAAIHSVIPNSPAERAGLRAGDVIQAIDNDDVAQLQDVMVIIRAKKANDKIKMTIIRDEQEMEVEAKLVLGKDLQ